MKHYQDDTALISCAGWGAGGPNSARASTMTSERKVDDNLEFHMKVAARKAKAQNPDTPVDMQETLKRLKEESRELTEWDRMRQEKIQRLKQTRRN